MRGWTIIWLIVWLHGGKTNADIDSQSLIGSSRALGMPPERICGWAHCKGLCSVDTIESSSNCSHILTEYSYAETDCGDKPFAFCIGPSSVNSSPCKPKGTKGTKIQNACFGKYGNTTTERMQAYICLETNSCEALSLYCSSHGYTDCIYYGNTTDEPPTTRSPDFTTSYQPITTNVSFTSEHNVTSTSSSPITDALDSAKSLAFLIGIVVGVCLITPIFVIILLICVIRRNGKKKYQVPRQTENLEMEEGAVYQAIGPALPPNHPTFGKGGNPTNRVNNADSSHSLEVTMELKHTEAGNYQGNQNTPYFALERNDKQYEEGMNKDNFREAGTNGTVFMNNITYNHGNSGHDVTRVYKQLERNGKDYSPVNDLTENANELVTRDTSISDKPYMALNVTGVDVGYVIVSNEETGHGGNSLHPRENSGHITPRDDPKKIENPKMTKVVKLNGTDLSQLYPASKDIARVSDQECSADVKKNSGHGEERKGNIAQTNVNPACNYQQGSTTFPRPKSLKMPSSGSASPKKSRFLSLRFGSKKKSKLSKKKLKNFCSADDSELCLDLTISSPTSPTEGKEASFFTAEVPIIQAPLPCRQEPQVPEKLSKSQEAIFDDVSNEPFRNRSRSQPIRQTFSPTLSKEYEEIKESWGATYLTVPSTDQK